MNLVQRIKESLDLLFGENWDFSKCRTLILEGNFIETQVDLMEALESLGLDFNHFVFEGTSVVRIEGLCFEGTAAQLLPV